MWVGTIKTTPQLAMPISPGVVSLTGQIGLIVANDHLGLAFEPFLSVACRNVLEVTRGPRRGYQGSRREPQAVASVTLFPHFVQVPAA